jgi:hypothetical protein
VRRRSGWAHLWAPRAAPAVASTTGGFQLQATGPDRRAGSAPGRAIRLWCTPFSPSAWASARCGPHLDSDRVSGVIELIAAADFKMNLITIPAEMDSPPHHSGHVHPEPGVGVWSERSRRRVTSACRRSHLSQPCLHPPLDLPVCLIRPWCGGEAGAGRWWRLVADPGGSGPAADRPTKNRWCTKRGTAAAGGST